MTDPSTRRKRLTEVVLRGIRGNQGSRSPLFDLQIVLCNDLNISFYLDLFCVSYPVISHRSTMREYLDPEDPGSGVGVDGSRHEFEGPRPTTGSEVTTLGQ